MPILKRDDGIQFAIHAYRELLQPVKASLLKSEIRMLAQNHGEYVRLFKLVNGQIEAVFSRDPGFLLGEAVWQYYDKPSDLIYCEALPEGNYALVVVVRAGSVYLDTKIPFSMIADEFASLVTGNAPYDIYIYGDVPVSDTKERGKFVFDRSQVKSFTRLEKSLFRTLPVDESLQLQPLEFALRSQKVAKKSWLSYVLLPIVLLLALAWWLHTPPKPTAVIQPISAPPVQVDPYQGYKNALATPAPEKQINEFISVLNTVYGIPGWQVTGVTFNNANYTIQLNSMGGEVSALNQWAIDRNIDMTLNSQGVTLSLRSNLNNRPIPEGVYNLQAVIDSVIDRIDRITTQPSTSLGKTTMYPNYKATDMTIQFNRASPDILTLIGRQLAGLPVTLSSIQTSVSEGLLSGTIQLTVLGN